MDVTFRKFLILTQICILIFVVAPITTSDDARNLQNHRNGVLNFKDIADHWIGYPRSPYTSFAVTASPTSPPPTQSTSVPVRTTKKPKKKKNKRPSSTRRRYDTDDDSDYRETQRSREKFAFQDFDYDYDGPIDSPYSTSYAPSPYVIRSSSAASAPKAVLVNPSMTSGNSQSMKAIYAGKPKVATYVIPDAKKYVVQRVKSELVYMPPASIPPNPSMYSAASNSGMRRVDPFDYEDNGGGGGNSFLNQGPRDSFPPRPVMNKITQAGQSQPCHGPDCHQHHKGLVRFYWRRVVYPPGRGRRQRGNNRTRRRRFRDGGRAPSDQKDVFYTEDDDGEDPGDESNTDDDDNDEEEEEENEEEDQDNEENDSSRRDRWRPGKAYGHNLNEGYNYNDQDKRTYRDKRYAYRNYRKRRREAF